MKITFLLPIFREPIGGIKVIYKQAEILTSLGIPSYILHPDDPDYRCDWFEHTALMRRDTSFNTSDDFVVIPEICAATYGSQLRAAGAKYAIYVQGGYKLTGGGLRFSKPEIRAAHEAAAVIMSISEDTTEVIALAFPTIPRTKIIRLYPHLGSNFAPGAKENLISYMGSKQPMHIAQLRFLLEDHLPPDWSLTAIQNMTEAETANILGRTAIFLSFAELEGFSLPPVEAAISGALVVGYTGQGAAEYFHPPVFRPVESGNIRRYVAEILTAIGDWNANIQATPEFRAGIRHISQTYSRENETARLLDFATRAAQCL